MSPNNAVESDGDIVIGCDGCVSRFDAVNTALQIGVTCHVFGYIAGLRVLLRPLMLKPLRCP